VSSWGPDFRCSGIFCSFLQDVSVFASGGSDTTDDFVFPFLIMLLVFSLLFHLRILLGEFVLSFSCILWDVFIKNFLTKREESNGFTIFSQAFSLVLSHLTPTFAGQWKPTVDGYETVCACVCVMNKESILFQGKRHHASSQLYWPLMSVEGY